MAPDDTRGTPDRTEGAVRTDPTGPTLPPPAAEGTRILTVPGAVVREFEVTDVIDDAVGAVDPAAIVATPPDASVVEPSVAGAVDVPVLTPGRGMRVDTVQAVAGRVVLAVPPTPEDLPPSPGTTAADGPGDDVADGPQYVVVTDALSLSVDPHDRETTLEGAGRYVDSLSDRWLAEDVTHLSTMLRPGYATTWTNPVSDVSIAIRGCGTAASRLGVGVDTASHPMTVLTCYPNGAVGTADAPPDRFGLRGLTGVSERRARRLREDGFTDRQAVADAAPDDLAGIESIGPATAARIRASATAIADERVVATGDGALPDGEPVFVDVETDGLSATTAWLVGVLDGDAADGNYLAFRQRAPDEPVDHLEAFVTWLRSTAGDRPVVAWHGRGFDFPVIREQLQAHCPDYLEAWDSRYLFDPLDWAAGEGNAALPGRTNELERVAGALGWEPTTTGLDGARVADVYVSWRNRVARADDPASVPTPDWDRLEAYCEDDVRALATIYDALADAARRPPDRSARTGEGSTQGSLPDFT